MNTQMNKLDDMLGFYFGPYRRGYCLILACDYHNDMILILDLETNERGWCSGHLVDQYNLDECLGDESFNPDLLINQGFMTRKQAY